MSDAKMGFAEILSGNRYNINYITFIQLGFGLNAKGP